MNKFKLALISLAFLFILWVASWMGLFNFISNSSSLQTNSETPTENSITNNSLESSQISVGIDFGDGKTFSQNYELSDSQNPYSSLVKLATEKNLEMGIKKYDFGVFVESIGDVKGSSEKAWIYFVNGESGTVAADQYQLSEGDRVEWKYITPEGE